MNYANGVRARMVTMRVATIALLSILVAPSMAQSQTAPLNMEIQVRERWLHGRENPRFRAFEPREYTLYFDTVREIPGGRTLDIRMSRTIVGGQIEQDATGRLRAISVVTQAPSESMLTRSDSFTIARFLWFELDRLSIPETRIWEVVPTHPPEGIAPGGQWVDTVRLETTGGGNRQALHGVRTSTLLGDTIVDGRRFRIVRDSMAAHYEETALIRDYTFEAWAEVTRVVDGVVRGRHLYDPRSGLFATRSDTMILAGSMALANPDGGRFTVPARYERMRTLTLYDEASWDALVAERRAQRSAQMGGMVVLPGDSLQARLRRGDTIARDSLLDEWHRAADPDERVQLQRILTQWGGAGIRERMNELALDAGDTAFATANEFGERRVDPSVIERLLPVLANPVVALERGMGVSSIRSLPYERISSPLLNSPPFITADTAQWGCVPAICRVLATLADTATESRLRDVGLLARFVMDPVAHQDAVRRRVGEGSVLLRPAVQLLDGVGARWAAASKAPLPPEGADWRMWLEWMSGRDPDYPAPSLPRLENRIRFEDSHAKAIRFYSAVTGRDVLGEIRQRYELAQDTARLMFGTILTQMDAMPVDTVDLARRLQSSDATEKQLAVTEFMRWFRNPGPVDPATAAELMDRAITNIMRDAPTDGSPVYIVGDSLPPALREKWAGRARIITSAERAALNPRERAFIVYPNPVRGIGSFVMTGASQTTISTRAPEEAPRAYASGNYEYLLKTQDGWVVISSGGWIT